MVVGVLALQGDFKEHLNSLERYQMKGMEVRNKVDLQKVDALIMPGGESTTISKLLVSTGLGDDIISRVKGGMPVWGTCAGGILLAKRVLSNVPLETNLKLIDLEIERNSYGTQADSFVASFDFADEHCLAFFIRAPRITSVGKGVKVLLEYKKDPILVQSKNVLISTFHSELSSSNPVLKYFLQEFLQLK
jgi:5'-phosphate synthase pdxT subunit